MTSADASGSRLQTAWDKTPIMQSFARAAGSYSAAALTQSEIAEALLTMLPTGQWPRLLDLGSGPASYAQQLIERCRSNTYVALDLAIPMLQQIEKTPEMLTLSGDIEALPLQPGSIDLAFANMSVQWCYELKNVLAEVHEVVADGGCFAFSTLVEGNFHELQQACTQQSIVAAVQQYPSTEELRQACETSDFRTIQLEQKDFTSYHDSFSKLLRSLRSAGVNKSLYASDAKKLSRADYFALAGFFDALRSSRGLPLTYKSALVVLQK